MKRFLTFVCELIFIAACSFAQKIIFSGDAKTWWGAYAPATEYAGNLSLGRIDLTGGLETYSEFGTAFVQGNVCSDFVTGQLSFDLSEAFVEYSTSLWGIRVGQQKLSWGRASSININNSIFPTDFKSIYSDDTSVAVKGMRLFLTEEHFSVDGFILPFFTGTKLPVQENNLLKSIVFPSYVTVTVDGTSTNQQINFINVENPECNFANMEYGLNANGFFDECNFSFYVFYGFDKTPILNYVQSNEPGMMGDGGGAGDSGAKNYSINCEYKKMGMTGFDFEVPVGQFVLRNENAFFWSRPFQVSSSYILDGSQSSVNAHQMVSLFGVDWFAKNWSVTAQYYFDLLFHKSYKMERTDAFEHGLTMSVSSCFLQNKLNFFVSGLLGLNYFDSEITGEFNYNISEQLKFSLGTYVFLPGPSNSGSFGKYKDLSSIYLKAEYKF